MARRRPHFRRQPSSVARKSAAVGGPVGLGADAGRLRGLTVLLLLLVASGGVLHLIFVGAAGGLGVVLLLLEVGAVDGVRRGGSLLRGPSSPL